MAKCTVFDYIDWRGDLSFQVSEFNEIDAIILSIFSYLDFSCVTNNEVCSFRNAIVMLNDMPDSIILNITVRVLLCIQLLIWQTRQWSHPVFVSFL